VYSRGRLIAAFRRHPATGEMLYRNLAPWQAGDIMLLDNPFTAHGRNRFEGGFHDVQVALRA